MFKSNICYLMQLIDYQIWLYKVFKPGLSLENALFYQLLITMGIISEALATCILLNPLIAENDKDVSMGKVQDNYILLQEKIVKNQFQNNIQVISKLKILPPPLLEKFTRLRIDIRNMIHIQNWDGRLYQQLSLEKFSEYLYEFKTFLQDVKKNIQWGHSAVDLSMEFFEIPDVDPAKVYQGEITQFDPVKGFGFIKGEAFHRSIYFHRSKSLLEDKNELAAGKKIQFTLITGKKGIEARLQ